MSGSVPVRLRLDIQRAQRASAEAWSVHHIGRLLSMGHIPPSSKDTEDVACDIREAYRQALPDLARAHELADRRLQTLLDTAQALERKGSKEYPGADAHAIARAARKGRYRPQPPAVGRDVSQLFLARAGRAAAQAVHWMSQWAEAHPGAKFVVHGRDADVIYALAKESGLRVRYVLSSGYRTTAAEDQERAKAQALRAIRGFESAVHVDSGYRASIPAWFASLPGIAVEAVYLVSVETGELAVDSGTSVFSPEDDAGAYALESLSRAFVVESDGKTAWYGAETVNRAVFDFDEALEYGRIYLLCFDECSWHLVEEYLSRTHHDLP